jgi:hypothetical protein
MYDGDPHRSFLWPFLEAEGINYVAMRKKAGFARRLFPGPVKRFIITPGYQYDKHTAGTVPD